MQNDVTLIHSENPSEKKRCEFQNKATLLSFLRKEISPREETHNKNEDNTLKELNEIFPTQYMVCLSKFLLEHYENLSESYVGRTPPLKRLTD